MSNFKLGRLPANPATPKLKLSSFLSPEFTYPENRDWMSQVSNWPMYLNDRIGDCTCATVGHLLQIFNRYGQKKDVRISDADVLKAYSDVSGYDPNTGANDDGAVVQDVLDYWRKTGVGGHKILAFAQVDFKNADELRQAVNIFGNIYLGINFPNTAMQQFDNDQIWDYVDGAYSEGGHAINAGYYDVSDGMWKVVTWGRVQPMTQAFFDEYVEEAWVVISQEWLDANGRNPEGLDMATLGDEFTKITGEVSPFPAPQPAPTPPPVVPPTPTPVNSADADFEKVLVKWLARNPWFYKDVQDAAKKWMTTR
jgi:hypothetical protein